MGSLASAEIVKDESRNGLGSRYIDVAFEQTKGGREGGFQMEESRWYELYARK